MSQSWGPYVNTTYQCPAFGFDGPHQNCAYPCSDNFFVLSIFFVSTPLDSANWNAKLTLSWLWSLIPTLLVFFPGLYALLGDRKKIPLTPLFGAAFVGFCSVWNAIMAKLVGLSDSRLKYRPGFDPMWQSYYTSLHGNYGKSCVGGTHGYGMPSGHSTNAMGACTWYVLETWWGWGKDKGYSTPTKLLHTVFAVLLCMPVLPARVGVYDHTWAQVVVGGAQGTILGAIFYKLMRQVIGPKLQNVCEWVNDSKFCPFSKTLCFGRPLVDTYWCNKPVDDNTGDNLELGMNPKISLELSPGSDLIKVQPTGP